MTTPTQTSPSKAWLPFVGRAAELELLRNSLETEGESKCVYISGPAGRGKTRLIEEFCAQNLLRAGIRCSGNIDLSIALYLSVGNLEHYFVDALDPDQKYFVQYRHEGQSSIGRKTAPGYSYYEERQEELSKLFVEEYAKLASDSKKSVIILDGLEKITNSLTIYGRDYPGTQQIKSWILEILPRLKNTLIILSGLSQPDEWAGEFSEQFRQAFQPELTRVELGRLSFEETKALAASLRQNYYDYNHDLSALGDITILNEIDYKPHRSELASTLSVPILHDKLVGVLAIQSNNRNTFSAEDASTIEAFARMASLSLQNAKEFEILRKNELRPRYSKRQPEYGGGYSRSDLEKLDYLNFTSQKRRMDLLRKQMIVADERQTDANLVIDPTRRARRISVDQALREEDRLIILGDPGSGKTTLLKYILLAHAENHLERLNLPKRRLPLFVRLYDYAFYRARRSSDYSLVDYLYTQARGSYSLELAPGFFEECLREGRCCVCLDGLDELGDSGLRRDIVQEVSALSHRYPKNQFIVTSRLVGYQEAPLNREQFKQFTILPFADDDIRQFVGKWYLAREKDPGVAREQTKNLVNTIMTEDRIRALASNPLMLTIIALVHRIEAELPNERVKLYDKCVFTLTETWDKVKGLHLTSHARQQYQTRRRLLERLAYWMHSQGSTGQAYEIRKGDLLVQLQKFLLQDERFEISPAQALDEAREMIELVQARTGILIERGEGVYTFVHLTFQEYLAACDIGRRCAHNVDELWQEIQPHLYDAHWREVILLLFGSLNEYERYNTELVERLLMPSANSREVGYQALFLAAQILSDHVIVKAALRRKVFETLAKAVRKGDFWSSQALTRLLEFPQELMAREELRAMISDRDLPAPIRQKILSALREYGEIDQELLDALQQLAFTSGDNLAVRLDGAYTLGCGGAPLQALEFLIACTNNKKLPVSDRSRAILYVGRLPIIKDQTLGLVVRVVSGKIHNPEILVAAADTLARLGDLDHALPLLKQLLKSSATVTNEKIRITIIELMGKYGRNDVDTIRELLHIAQAERMKPGIRLAACKMLASMGQDDVVIPVLKRMSYKWSNATKEKVRFETAALMEYLNQKEDAIKIFLQIGKSIKASFEIRCQAALSLYDMGETADGLKIGHLLETEDKWSSEHKLQLAETFARVGHLLGAIETMKLVASNPESNTDQKMIAFDFLLGNNQEGFVNHIYQQIVNRLANDAKSIH